MGGGERRALGESLFVEVEATETQQPAVEAQPPVGSGGDAADPTVGGIAGEAPALAVGERERGVVEVGVVDRPQARVVDRGEGLGNPGRVRRNRDLAEVEWRRPVAAMETGEPGDGVTGCG